MTTEDLLRAIGSVDEKELAHAQRKTVKPIIWIITALVLAAALLLPILLIRREKPLAHTVLAEKPSWNMDADVLVEFDDGLVIDKETRLESMRNDVLSGIGGAKLRALYLKEKYNLNDAEAAAWARMNDPDANSEPED